MKTTIEWHSVKEMLPERKGLLDDEMEYVLVCEYYPELPYMNQCITICGYDKNGFSDFDSFGRADPKRITHWAYLPEPPEVAP